MDNNQPMIELISDFEHIHIKIWANGRIEGFNGTLINRMPQVIDGLIDAIAKGIIGLDEDIKTLKGIPK